MKVKTQFLPLREQHLMNQLSKVCLLLLHRYRLEVSKIDVGVIIDSDIRDVFLRSLMKSRLIYDAC